MSILFALGTNRSKYMRLNSGDLSVLPRLLSAVLVAAVSADGLGKQDALVHYLQRGEEENFNSLDCHIALVVCSKVLRRFKSFLTRHFALVKDWVKNDVKCLKNRGFWVAVCVCLDCKWSELGTCDYCSFFYHGKWYLLHVFLCDLYSAEIILKCLARKQVIFKLKLAWKLSKLDCRTANSKCPALQMVDIIERGR